MDAARRVPEQAELFLLGQRVAQDIRRRAPHVEVDVPNHADVLVDDMAAGRHLIASTVDWATVWRAYPYDGDVVAVDTGLAPGERDASLIGARLVSLLAD